MISWILIEMELPMLIQPFSLILCEIEQDFDLLIYLKISSVVYIEYTGHHKVVSPFLYFILNII